MKFFLSAIVASILLVQFCNCAATTSSTTRSLELVRRVTAFERMTDAEVQNCIDNVLRPFVDSVDIDGVFGFWETMQNMAKDSKLFEAICTAPGLLNSITGHVQAARSTPTRTTQSKPKTPARAPHLQLNNLNEPPYSNCYGGAYGAYVATVLNAWITPGDGGVCSNTGDWNAEAGLKIGLWIARGLVAGFDAICEATKADCVSTLPGAPCVPVSGAFCAAKLGAEIALAILDSENNRINFHDQAVLDSVLQSVYENTAEIFEAVQCKASDSIRKYQGCNGADDNCDLVNDDCAEDQYAPEISVDLDALHTVGWFNSFSSASNFADSITTVVDDCKNAISRNRPVFAGRCNTTTATIDVSDECGNGNSVTFVIPVDDQSPTIECAVAKPVLKFMKTPAMIDVGFAYAVADNCGAEVVISIISDEPPQTHLPDAYVKRDYYGNYVGVVIRNAGSSVYGRKYIITATATDPAGNQATCSQEVKIPAFSRAARPIPYFNPDTYFSVL